jgi:hypothetical protein
MSCALYLNKKGSYHYEILRKKMPFILLSDKRIFYEFNNHTTIPVDCFF